MHFKSEMGIFSGYIYFSLIFFLPRTYTLIIQTYEPDGRRGEGGEEIQMYEQDVGREMERGRQN